MPLTDDKSTAFSDLGCAQELFTLPKRFFLIYLARNFTFLKKIFTHSKKPCYVRGHTTTLSRRRNSIKRR
jgi:hypothetical protein